MIKKVGITFCASCCSPNSFLLLKLVSISRFCGVFSWLWICDKCAENNERDNLVKCRLNGRVKNFEDSKKSYG